MNKRNVILGALAGVAAGALLGVLFAPDKGSATRQKISKKSREYVDGVKGKMDDLIDDISDRFASVKEGFMKGTNKTHAHAEAS